MSDDRYGNDRPQGRGRARERAPDSASHRRPGSARQHHGTPYTRPQSYGRQEEEYGRGGASGSSYRPRSDDRQSGSSRQQFDYSQRAQADYTQRPQIDYTQRQQIDYAQRPQIDYTQKFPESGAGSSKSVESPDVAGSSRRGGGDVEIRGRMPVRTGRIIDTEILHTRPKGIPTKNGRTGRRINLEANYFRLISKQVFRLFQYRVDFSPDEERTIVRRGLVRCHRAVLGPHIFDGTILFTIENLPEEVTEFVSQRVSDSADIKISVRKVGEVEKGDPHYIQAFNLIMRKCLRCLNLQLVGRNYFDAMNRVEIRQYKLELWPGYVTSIRQHERDILMCAEISHKVMRQQTLLDILHDCYVQDRERYQDTFKRQVIGCIVLTAYNNNTYRVDDVDFEVTPHSTFRLRTGEDISYQDYYNNKYGIRITQGSQPMLVTRSRNRDKRAAGSELVYLVPELCNATGLTDQMRNDFHLMRSLAEHTRVSPRARIEKLLNFNNRLTNTPPVMQEFADWKLELERRLVQVPARVIDPEEIHFGGDEEQKMSAGPRADWTVAFKTQKLFRVGQLKDWIVMVTGRLRRDSENFVRSLLQVSRNMRFPLDPPQYVELRDDNAANYCQELEELLRKRSPMMILCIVSNNRNDRYGAIKRKCCVDRPVPTQVVQGKTLQGRNTLSIATKVAIQMNCKIGGIPWSVPIKSINGLMVAGFDVCHDPESKGRDYGALVASLDRHHGRYFSAVSSHASGEELSNQLSANMCRALQQYRELNKCLPVCILIYRDGVGEGQLPYVFQHEVEHLKAALVAMYEDPKKVRMAFVIVTKRINTRLFFNRENPPAGTIVDDVITNPMKYDFFIISQSVRQGTVTPTSYSIISDSSGLHIDMIQTITYKLTHMYYNWSGSVRVPAPCQYAHKLAFLVSQSIRKVPNPQLSNLLYFL